MDIFESLENLNVSEECFEEIMGIVEEIINEVSVGAWARAAGNEDTYKKRKEKLEAARKEVSKLPDKERYTDGHPTNKKFMDALHKVEQVEKVRDLNLPKNSKVSTKKLLDAADRVDGDRYKKMMDKYEQITDPESGYTKKGVTKKEEKEYDVKANRSGRSSQITDADPTSTFSVPGRSDRYVKTDLRKANRHLQGWDEQKWRNIY